MAFNCTCCIVAFWRKKNSRINEGLGKGINEFKKGKNESEDKSEEN
jgi:hypothetical protein